MSEVINKHSRMPRKLSRQTLRRREREQIGGVNSLTEANPHAMLARYMAGEKVKDIAAQYGVCNAAIYSFLLKFVPEEWKDAQKARALARKELAEEGLDVAADALELAKEREKLRAAQWDLERVYRPIYGREEPQVHVHFADLGDRLRRARERVIDMDTTEQQSIEHKEGMAVGVNVARAQEPISVEN